MASVTKEEFGSHIFFLLAPIGVVELIFVNLKCSVIKEEAR